MASLLHLALFDIFTSGIDDGIDDVHELRISRCDAVRAYEIPVTTGHGGEGCNRVWSRLEEFSIEMGGHGSAAIDLPIDGWHLTINPFAPADTCCA